MSVIAELAREQTWSNFKSEVASWLGGDQAYRHALHDVWGVMKKLQQPEVLGIDTADPITAHWRDLLRGNPNHPAFRSTTAGVDLEPVETFVPDGPGPKATRATVTTSVLDEVPPPDPIWDGITKPETLNREAVTLRQDLANRAKNYEWPRVLSILSE